MLFRVLFSTSFDVLLRIDIRSVPYTDTVFRSVTENGIHISFWRRISNLNLDDDLIWFRLRKFFDHLLRKNLMVACLYLVANQYGKAFLMFR